MLEQLKNWILASKKAIAAFIVTAVVGYTARHGWDIDAGTQDALRTLLEGLVSGVVVYWTTNQVGSVDRKR